MMTSMLILSLAYALVAALLSTLCITLPGKRGLKISLIALVSVFYAVTWIGHQSMLGWPTSEDMPVAFLSSCEMHAISRKRWRERESRWPLSRTAQKII